MEETGKDGKQLDDVFVSVGEMKQQHVDPVVEESSIVGGAVTAQNSSPPVPAAAEDAASPDDSDEEEEDEEEDEGVAVPSGSEESSDDINDDEEGMKEFLLRFEDLLALKEEEATTAIPTTPPLLSSFDLKGVADLIASGRATRIICMCGAGISVSAGIPDFRSPGTGLYSQLEKYGLPHPEAVFDIDFFRKNPKPFFLLAKELYPGTYAPTPTHHFFKLLHDKGLLVRCFTQNIDSLECSAGLPCSAVVAAHGNFDSARCIDCRTEHTVEYVKTAVFQQQPCYCEGKGRAGGGCKGLVKPEIVFFGENLPARFFTSLASDLPTADLLLVAGTSLVVQPFASLVEKVPVMTPRVLINRERVGEANPLGLRLGVDKGFNFGQGNYRDALFEGDCDDGIWELCRLLGWEEELQALIDGWTAPF